MQPKLTAEIITLDKPATSVKDAPTWSDKGGVTLVTGQVAQITVVRGREAQFGIRILEDGSIIITDHGHLCWKHYVEQNIRFEPERPWTKKA